MERGKKEGRKQQGGAGRALSTASRLSLDFSLGTKARDTGPKVPQHLFFTLSLSLLGLTSAPSEVRLALFLWNGFGFVMPANIPMYWLAGNFLPLTPVAKPLRRSLMLASRSRELEIWRIRKGEGGVAVEEEAGGEGTDLKRT